MVQTNDGIAAPLAVPSSWPVVEPRPAEPSSSDPLRAVAAALERRGLRMSLKRDSERTLVQLQGRLDRQSAPLLKDATREIVALSSARIDIDMSGVDRVDGVGLAALVWGWGTARDGGRELRLTHVQPYVREIIAKMNLHQLLRIVDSPTDA